MSEKLTNRQAAQALLEGRTVLLAGKPATGKSVDLTRLDEICDYTLAPQTITRSITYPAPETVAPEFGTFYWVPDVLHANLCECYEWHNSAAARNRLAAGLVYLNKDHAIARAKEMLK